MKDGFITIATASIEISIANCKKNAERIISTVNTCNGKKAKLLVFSELCITGYTCGDLFLQDYLLNDAIDALNFIVQQTKKTDVLFAVGMPLSVECKLFNVAVIIKSGQILGVVPKSYIPNYTEYYECRHFASAFDTTTTEITLLGQKVAFGTDILFKCNNIENFAVSFEICEDLWVAESPSISHAMAGALIIGNLSASNEIIGKSEYRRNLVKIQSAKLSCIYAYSSSGEGESTTDLVFSGQKLICENGKALKETLNNYHNDDKVMFADADLSLIAHERRRMNTFINKTKKDYRVIEFSCEVQSLVLERKYEKTPFVPFNKDELDSRCLEVLSLQSAGLVQRIKHINASKLIIGISGGLDSTLALLVIVDALKRLNRSTQDIIAITMPGAGTTDATFSNANRLVLAVGATLKVIPIVEEFNAHLKAIGHNGEPDVTFENAQARERMQILMDCANMYNGIVVGTPDLSEIALGFSTYNGDHMSMYGVNASVPKTLIRYLINYIAEHSEEDLKEVLLDVVKTPVSPELLPIDSDGNNTQHTEKILGDYILHDFILYYFVRFGFTPEKILRLLKQTFTDYSETDILTAYKTFFTRFYNNQFKRSCMPDGVKIGSVSLSPRGDFRMPSDCSKIDIPLNHK